MHLSLTEEQLMIRNAARDFAIHECLPGVIERDEQQKFPYEQVKKLAELGFLGMMVSADYGGSGLDTVGMATISCNLLTGSEGVMPPWSTTG